ncbi:MAG: AMP-binding protein, partial [Candidatus Methylomirabilales bacterium]
MVAAENLPVQFFEAAARFQDSVAFQIKRDGRTVRWSYGEVADQAHRLATFLRRIEISPGDRIALLSGNRPEWCVAYLGIVAAGATAVPLDVQLGVQELENLLQHSESRAIVVSEAELDKVQPFMARLPTRPRVILLDEKAPTGVYTLAEILQGSPRGPLPAVPSESPASILYTSGTTGSPKGVILTHRNLVA